MSIAQSSRCLFCKWIPARSQGSIGVTSQRQFHTTPSPHARRKPAFQNIRAVDLGLIVERAPTRYTKAKQRPDKKTAPEAPSKLAEPSSHEDELLTMHRQTRHKTRQDLENAEAVVRKKSEFFQQYTPREKQLLALKYSPQQLRALEAAEEAINPKHMVAQGRMRNDAMRVEYKDDYSKILPLIDFPVRAPDEDVDPGIRPLSAEETRARFAEWYEKVSRRVVEDAESRGGLLYEEQETLEDLKTGIEAAVYPGDGLTPEQRMARLRDWAQRREGIDHVAEFERFAADPSNFFYSPTGRLDSQSHSLSDPLPRLEDPRITTVEESEEPAKERLSLQTGLSQDQIRRLNVRVLVDHRVVNQTRMGKIASFYFLAIAGNGDGLLGIGEGKSVEPIDGDMKARIAAIRNMRPIPRYEDRTIFGEAEAKVGASIVKLSARSPGFGIRCPKLTFEMARAAGIQDLAVRCLRSRNKMNVAKATYAALMGQRLPEEVAKARGRKMVDVRKVYYEGAVN